MMPGSSSVYIFANSGAGRRIWHGVFEEPADEFGLAFRSGFRENPRRVGTRRRSGDPEPRGGGNKPISANDFRKNACLGGSQPEPCRKAPDLSAKFGGLIGDEEGCGWRLNIEDRHRMVGGQRKDMGEKRQGIFGAAKLESATYIAFASSRLRSPARERMQPRGEHGSQGC